jgi:hypothetical protein
MRQDVLDCWEFAAGLSCFVGVTIAVCLYVAPGELIIADMVVGGFAAACIRSRRTKPPTILVRPEPECPCDSEAFKKAA